MPKRSVGLESYFELVAKFPLVSIKSRSQFDAAQRAIDEVFAKGTLDEGEETYVDALGDLIATYEDRHCSFAPASDADMLRHLLNAKGVSQAELSRAAAIPKSSISEVLANKKPFSRTMIRKLANYFHVDVSVLTANVCRDLAS